MNVSRLCWQEAQRVEFVHCWLQPAEECCTSTLSSPCSLYPTNVSQHCYSMSITRSSSHSSFHATAWPITLQSRRTHPPSSECQCCSVQVCRPTSPESLTCHLDLDSDHPHLNPINWLFRLTTSLLSTGGPFQFLLPFSGTVSLHISHQHRRSPFSRRVLRLFSSGATILT